MTPLKRTPISPEMATKPHLPNFSAAARRGHDLTVAGAVALALLLLFLGRPGAASSWSATKWREVIDPATGFLVCRSERTASYGELQVSQCVGWCSNGNGSYYGRRRLAGRASPWGAACGKYNDTGGPRTSCVRSPALGCRWIRVTEFVKGGAFSQPEYYAQTGCIGPAPGTCTLYSDPFCSNALNGEPERKKGGASCQGRNDVGYRPGGTTLAEAGLENITWNSTSMSDSAWCGDVASYLWKQLKPASCPNVTETSIDTRYYGPWIAIRSCEDGGNYLAIRRAGYDMVQCLGPGTQYGATPPRCSWYTDVGLSILAPGEPEPYVPHNGDEQLGMTCTQTNSGWCKVAGDAAFRGADPSYDCPGRPFVTPTRTSTTTTPGPARTVSPKSDWHCLGHAYCKQTFLMFRHVDADGRDTYQCLGQGSGSCFAYGDESCSEGSRKPDLLLRAGPIREASCGRSCPTRRNDGSEGYVCIPADMQTPFPGSDGNLPFPCEDLALRCALSESWFLHRPEWDFINGAPTPEQTQPASTAITPPSPTPAAQPPPWTCVRSCNDNGNFVAVRAAGRVAQCRGPDGQRCSWYTDAACSILAPGEPQADGGGMVCPERAEGWCALAVAVLSGSEAADRPCSSATGSAIVARPTAATSAARALIAVPVAAVITAFCAGVLQS